jgi:hypothetical protein
VAADCHPHVLKEELLRFSKEWVTISEQDFHNRIGIGHIANTLLDVLNEHFDDRVLSNHFPERFGYGWSWPPYYPDLNPCDYFLWGFLKDTVYKNNL